MLDSPYYHCSNCDLIFLPREEIPSRKKEKERYEEHDNNHQNDGYVKMFKDFIERAVEPYIDLEPNKLALEFGCGHGPVLADLLKETGLEVDLYDPYFFPEKVYQSKKYDLITSTEVFEHFSDPYSEVKCLKNHLKEDGILAIMTHFHSTSPEFDFEEWWYTYDATHITFYSWKTMEWIADEFSFDIVYKGKKKLFVFKK
jgi:cyclopropane fatty-acyl-phospholipid synthase-like methyltransferase